MFEWLLNNAPTIIICICIALIVVAIILYLYKQKKKGVSCGCSCASCPMAGKCTSLYAHKDTDVKTDENAENP